MKRVLLIIVLMICANIGFGQNEPSIYCLQVNEDGSTTIYYKTVTGADFLEYIISAFDFTPSVNAYLRVGGVSDINQNQYTDYTQNANLAQIYYLITADYSTSSRTTGDAKTMFLTTTQLSETSFTLNWTSMGTTIVGSQGQKYKIYRRFASQGNWVDIDSTSALTYTDNFPPVCSDTVSYRIERPNVNGCSSVSNMKKFFIGDNEIPLEPVLLSSSIGLTSQQLNLSWTPSTSVDTWGYVICSGNPCVALDTIYGADVSSYTCNTCSVEQVNSLAIMAFDSCFNTSLRTNPHKNMVLTYSRASCSTEINLSWTPYDSSPVNVTAYNVYISQNGGAFSLFETLTSDKTSLLFNANAAIENYCFYIEAILSNGQMANSNKTCSSQSLPKQVDFAYIRYASVNEDNENVELRFYVDASLVVRGYDLYRAKGSEDFELIKTLSYSGNNSFIYVDTPPASAAKTMYRYKLQVPDACDLLFKTSNIVSTIKLDVDASDADKNLLTWNDVLGWTNVETYEIYRIDESSPLGLQIGNSSSASIGYEDNLSSMVSTSDKISYYVVAKEGSAAPDGVNVESRSSTVPVVKETLIFIPNSFTPTDIANNVFKPSCSFIKSGTYYFRIMNRWGEVLFETHNPSEGWDGKFKGKMCSAAAYVYVLECINSEGEKVKRAGTVNLIN